LLAHAHSEYIGVIGPAIFTVADGGIASPYSPLLDLPLSTIINDI